MALADGAPGGFADGGESLGQNLVQGFGFQLAALFFYLFYFILRRCWHWLSASSLGHVPGGFSLALPGLVQLFLRFFQFRLDAGGSFF